MDINEYAQWLVLVTLSVFVFGLLRQLGRFINPGEHAMSNQGPKVDEPMPETLFAPDNYRVVAGLARGSAPGFAVILFLREGCVGCEHLLDSLAEHGTPEAAPIVAVTLGDPSVEFHARLTTIASAVFAGAEPKLKRESITASPLILLVDRSLVVQEKFLGGDIRQAVDHWRAGKREPSPRDADSLMVVHSRPLTATNSEEASP